MRNKQFKNNLFLLSFLLLGLLFIGMRPKAEDDKNGSKQRSTLQKTTINDSYRFRVNRLDMPMNNRGVMAAVDLVDITDGQYDGKGFLFSGGFFMGGKNGNILWVNAVCSASRTEDYLPGPTAVSQDDLRAKLYILKSSDPPFGDVWQDWKNAVDLGAYFYDGDKDTVYNPVDKNSNGKWDADEDRPDLLGDETAWCVYSDKLPKADRDFSNVDPLGIDICQTVWGYAAAGDLGNILFIRYSINNSGSVVQRLDSVYFGLWADPDIGGSSGYTDDLVGSDLTLNSGYVYNDGPDATFGVDPPCFLIDFFQGPLLYTNNPSDIAFNVKGPVLGTDTIYGAINLGLSSFVHYMQSHATQGDPDNREQAYNYLTGRNLAGQVVNPCTWKFGTVLGGVPCASIDGRFMYSGDPVAQVGWINNTPTDQRQMSNTGPFVLEKDKPVDIIGAYVVGRSTSALKSVTKAKTIDRTAQIAFQNNFDLPGTPPEVKPIIKTDENSIELIWETAEQLNYKKIGRDINMIFENFQVFMHNVNSVSEFEGGKTNTVLIAGFDVANEISDLVVEDPVTVERKYIYEMGTQLDSATYADPATGRISLKITTDPFTNAPLIKGKPYFISIVSTAVNLDQIKKLEGARGYYVPYDASLGYLQTIPKILSDGVNPVGIVPGKDLLTPYPTGIAAEHPQGNSEVVTTYEVKDRNAVTSDPIEIGFRKDASSTLYNLFYYLKNNATDQIIFDSLLNYGEGSINNMINGVVVNVEWINPKVASYEYSGTGESWFTLDTVKNKVGPFYMGNDVMNELGIPIAISGNQSKVIKADQMKGVELRFGTTSNVYRYVRKPARFVFAGDSGVVSVPFQAWYVDEEKKIEQQLAVGFTETAAVADAANGKPDGIYDPGTDVSLTKEYIIVFNTPYDPACGNYVYTGNTSRWSDLGNGYQMQNSIPGLTDSMKTIGASPYFDALYVVGLQRRSDAGAFNPTGKYIIDVTKPLTISDKYIIANVSTDLSMDEKKALFDKVNVFPNPLFAYNPGVGYTGGSPDVPYITFSNLPNQATVKIYTINGSLIRTLEKYDNSAFMTWDLQNEDGLRAASGMYLAIVTNLELGDKVLKFAIIMPQKQIQKF